MGLFDFFSTSSDKDVGTKVLKAYFDEASQFSDFNYGTYDAWLVYLNSKGVPDFDVFIGELVNANKAAISPDDAAYAVANLANSSGGKATNTQIVSAAGGKGDTINWSEAVPEITSQSAADLLAATQNVGQGVLSTFKVAKYLPWILGAAGVIYIVMLAKSTGGSIGKIRGLK